MFYPSGAETGMSLQESKVNNMATDDLDPFIARSSTAAMILPLWNGDVSVFFENESQIPAKFLVGEW